MALNKRQQRFCDEYLIDLNATQAAIRAGYSKKTAYSIGVQLLKNLEIKTYIEERMAQKDAELIASQDEVLKYLTSVMRNETKEQVVVTEAYGVGESVAKLIEKDTSVKDRNKAAELLGKRYGLYVDKQDVTGAIPVVVCNEDGLED